MFIMKWTQYLFLKEFHIGHMSEDLDGPEKGRGFCADMQFSDGDSAYPPNP